MISEKNIGHIRYKGIKKEKRNSVLKRKNRIFGAAVQADE